MSLKSSVFYKITCVGCGFRYVGETSRYLSTRIKEHLASDKNAHILKHLSKNSDCKNNTSPNCFKIIDSDKYFLKLKIKEGFHITREKPELNVQLNLFKTSFI